MTKDQFNIIQEQLKASREEFRAQNAAILSRLDGLEKRMNYWSGIYLGGIIFIATIIGIYINVVMMR